MNHSLSEAETILFSLLQMQRYEGASTTFGPNQLKAYIKLYTEMAVAMATVIL